MLRRLSPILSSTSVRGNGGAKKVGPGKDASGGDKSSQIEQTSECTTSRAPSSTQISYLSSIFSSLWSSSNAVKEIDEKSKAKKKAIRLRTMSLSKAELLDQTENLVEQLLITESDGSIMLRTRELCRHLVQHPEARHIAQKNSLIKKLQSCLKITSDEAVRNDIRIFFTVMGYYNPPKGAGVRILSLDGGGTRGVLGLDVLQALENCLNGQKIVDVFDLIVGVSTGAIIASLLTAKRLSVSGCKEVYMNISRDLFSQGKFSGVSGLLLSHAYYNTEKWRETLKKVIGEETLLESCRCGDSAKLAIVSCTVNTPTLKPYIFRTYGHSLKGESHYLGGCNHKLWEAVQASAAAPGYFQEVPLGSLLHQDGGVLINNPTALAIHEARMIWPNEKIQSVISIGNGRTSGDLEPVNAKSSTGIQEKILRIIDSATDTELVDLYMRDILTKSHYMRFNPFTTYCYSLDEIDPKMLAQMTEDAHLYIKRNKAKLEVAAEKLLYKSTFLQYFKRKFTSSIL